MAAHSAICVYFRSPKLCGVFVFRDGFRYDEKLNVIQFDCVCSGNCYVCVCACGGRVTVAAPLPVGVLFSYS